MNFSTVRSLKHFLMGKSWVCNKILHNDMRRKGTDLKGLACFNWAFVFSCLPITRENDKGQKFNTEEP